MAKFGLNLQLEEYPIDLALKTAKLAENLKLEAVFVNDHYMKPLRLQQVAKTSLQNEEKHRQHIELIHDKVLSKL